jgi:2-polyprenyl-3-methyl-5-hydroxy-6-metoxy-1,4-benzoquinol methylase
MTQQSRPAFDALSEWYEQAFTQGRLPLLEHLLMPAVLDLVGDVRELAVLDLACCPGFYSDRLARRGARVTGTDISDEMLRRAREHVRGGVHRPSFYHLSAAELAPSWTGTFDLVLCIMAMVDIPDIDDVLKEVARVLKPDGRFVFAVIHPCFVMPGAEWVVDEEGNPDHKRVDSYFAEGYFGKEWYGQGGLRSRLGGHHRTLTTYIRALRGAGFALTDLLEPQPSPDALRQYGDDLILQTRIPSMLVFEARKWPA